MEHCFKKFIVVKYVVTSIVMAALVAAFTVTSYAASDLITTVKVGFSETKEDPGVLSEAEPMVKTSNCEIINYSCSSDYYDWKAGSKVTFTIEIMATNGRYFNSSKTKVETFTANSEVASKSVSGDTMTVKVNYWPSMQLAAPENIYWEDGFTACWDKVKSAGQYELNLTITDFNEKVSTKKVTTKNTKIDLSQYATGESLTFKIRAIPNDSQKKYLSASDWVSCDEETGAAENNTATGSFSGSGNKLLFKIDRKTTASGWQKINNRWYYFDPANKNYAVCDSWKNINGFNYRFDTNCQMQTGWVLDGTLWYYLNPNPGSEEGKMVVGWINMGPSGPWYWCNDGKVQNLPYGAMLANGVTPDGYAVAADGKWIQ